MDYQQKINEPTIILAGAGTGKTYAIVEKIKHLINNKIFDPNKIVCITFSNEAANNLALRISPFLRNGESSPIIRTFHAFSADLLREHCEKIGLKPDFKILDPDEAKVVLHRNFRIQPYHCHRYVDTINSCKDLGISIESLENYLQKKGNEFKDLDLEKKLEDLQFELQTIHLKDDKEAKREVLEQVKKISSYLDLKKFVSSWKAYEKIKTKNNYQDYSDLNNNALNLLRNFPQIAANYDYIIVDEFQDTNKVQLDFLLALASRGNITIVGDLNQSIYRFRGAYRDNFEVFKKHFNLGSKDIFNLDKSRRSSNKILRAAHRLIINNYSDPSDCFEVVNYEGREGEEILTYELKNGKEEARKVVELVKTELKEGSNPEDICIVFRTHQQGRGIRKALELEGVPFTSASKGSLFKNKLVRSVIDYLCILEKLHKNKKGGEQSWWDLIYQLDFPDGDLIKLGRLIRDNRENANLSAFLFEALPQMPLSDFGRKLAEGLISKIKLMRDLNLDNVVELIRGIYGLLGLSEESDKVNNKESLLNLNKFLELAQSHSSLYYSDLSHFIDYLEVLENLGIEIPSADVNEKGVRLMTLHATKGLEYKTVIVTNMVNKKFPIEKINLNSMIPIELSPEFSKLSTLESEFLNDAYLDHERKHQIAEERRLCYVAFTRAKEKLALTYALEYGGKKFAPSTFLEEIKYKDNADIIYKIDHEEKYQEPETVKPAKLGFSFVIEGKEIEALHKDSLGSPKESKARNGKCFSPSALLLFEGCQKEYEYKYVYNMPERKTISWEAMRLGSFVHFILEKGVQLNLRDLKQFLDLARVESQKEEWAGVELGEVSQLIKVFFERNKNKYSEKSLTEQELRVGFEGFEFIGFADRIDFSDKGIEIIDYKTGRQPITPKHRDWQLGYYALAAQKLGKVYKVTLDMLKQEKPLEFAIDAQGNAKSEFGRMCFNIYDVRSELVETAKAITGAYIKGFKPCPIEKNCEFCNEYVYGL